MVGAQHLVGMGDIHVASGPAAYTCLGLGSCIGLAALDSRSGVSGMVHIMLPKTFPGKAIEKPGKFADIALTEMLGQMEKLGANPRSIVVAYAGGAQVFQFGNGGANRMDVGRRNAEAVAEEVARLKLRVVATEVGGNNGRTVTFDAATGEVRVRSVHGGEKTLARLR